MAHSKKNTATEEKNEENPNRLPDLPDDLLKHSIFCYLPPSAQALLGRSSRRFAAFPEYEEATRAIKGPLKQFLLCVARGQKDQAEALIVQNPDLLLFESEVSDYSGRKLQGTALGIALGAEDVNLYANNGKLLGEGMVEMLHRHLRKLPDGEAKIAQQTLKQFPEGWEEQEEKRYEGDFNALCKVWRKINASFSNVACEEFILEFKNHLAPKEVITTGKHWHAKLLQAAFKMGSTRWYLYNDSKENSRKSKLFYSQVIGHIQSLAPANYAMAQAQGLGYLLEQGENFERILTYRFGAGHYYPLCSSGNFRLGADSWLSTEWGQISTSWPSNELLPSFQNYVGAKTTALRQFISQPDSHRNTNSCCVMM